MPLKFSLALGLKNNPGDELNYCILEYGKYDILEFLPGQPTYAKAMVEK